MGVDLALQRFHARLQQQSFLLLQFHLDANVVQHLQGDGDGHYRPGIDCELHSYIGRVQGEEATRKFQMQLDVNELQCQDQEEERRLPVDERLANAAANPVVNTQVEQRRE